MTRSDHPRLSSPVVRHCFRHSSPVIRLFLLLSCLPRLYGAELLALPEHLRADPFGGVVAADRPADGAAVLFHDAKRLLSLACARGGYASFQLVVKMPEGGEYTLTLESADPKRKLDLEVFREWYHAAGKDRAYYPDALVPVLFPIQQKLPDAGNRIGGQTSQAFWVDAWVPADAVPGPLQLRATLVSGKKRWTLPVELKISAATIPPDDVVIMDHNSYGSSWLGTQYDGVQVPSDESLRLSQLYHRLFYEHRGIYHQLGYGHGGRVIPEFAPGLTGSGRNRRIGGWDLYDRHYGPLLDGSAFQGTRRGPKPVPFVYLPINPEWPASFLGWGEPGYEAEFVNVVSAMEKHFREKGWTRTRFEMFFNHKKRYKAFPWDGDETRFEVDDRYFVEYARLLKKALPADTPVQFVFRSDASWSIERQFRTLAGIVNFWVCGNSMLSWYREAVEAVKARGDIVWIYGGAPSVQKPSVAIAESALRTWIYGVGGWVHWQTVDGGPDPWFQLAGGGEILAYPGTRFGIRGPIPSLRLKLQRNCLQDLALLDSMRSRVPIDKLRDEASMRFCGTPASDWWTPRPALADGPPHEWTNATIDEATNEKRPYDRSFGSGAWFAVRQYTLSLAEEAK